MGNAVYPSLPGLEPTVRKLPEFSTLIRRSVSGNEVRASQRAYPLWEFVLGYEVLRGGVELELQTLVDFFCARRGAFDSFRFTDPDDCTVTGQQFGTGDGATLQFQLVRSMIAGGFLEPVMNLNGAPTIYKAGVEQSAGYTVSATGMVTFDAAPAIGAALTWDGAYYFRCRFQRDSSEFERFLEDLWKNKKVELVGSLGTKI
jgi:uncharacterized protein (TIGR02217 family)